MYRYTVNMYTEIIYLKYRYTEVSTYVVRLSVLALCVGFCLQQQFSKSVATVPLSYIYL